MNRKRVLIADDHDLTRQQLREIIEGDCDVIGEARDGQEAIDAILRLQPDLVLLDVSMPVRDGFAVARHLQQHQPAVRILFVSQNDAKVYREEAIRSGARGFVRKDSVITELLPAILAALQEL